MIAVLVTLSSEDVCLANILSTSALTPSGALSQWGWSTVGGGIIRALEPRKLNFTPNVLDSQQL